jgi:hypothetical protein
MTYINLLETLPCRYLMHSPSILDLRSEFMLLEFILDLQNDTLFTIESGRLKTMLMVEDYDKYQEPKYCGHVFVM